MSHGSISSDVVENLDDRIAKDLSLDDQLLFHGEKERRTMKSRKKRKSAVLDSSCHASDHETIVQKMNSQ